MTEARSIEVTPRELALIHESLSNQLKNTHALLESHINQDDDKFDAINRALYDPTTGITYRMYGNERTVKGACVFLRWFSGIAGSLIVVLIVYIASQVTEVLRLNEQIKQYIPQINHILQMKQEPPKK